MSDDPLELLSSPQQDDKFVLRLYVADGTPRSIAASRNLKQLCEEHLAGRYQIEVIDLLKNPRRAQEDQILAVPTLVWKLPPPIRKFIGNLSNPERVLVNFDFGPHQAFPSPPKMEESKSADKHFPSSERPQNGKYVLRLYVAGSTPQSSRAITNIKTICETHLKDRYALAVVDLYQQRERARDDQIMVAPTLIRQSPLPVRRLIGDLSQTERVLVALDLPSIPDQA
jgi:circadian clock protein KaiB